VALTFLLGAAKKIFKFFGFSSYRSVIKLSDFTLVRKNFVKKWKKVLFAVPTAYLNY
jgi:hypothetical protein